jgi:hypothetical protein
MATSFSGGRSRREPPTMGKQMVNFTPLTTIFPLYRATVCFFEQLTEMPQITGKVYLVKLQIANTGF